MNRKNEVSIENQAARIPLEFQQRIIEIRSKNNPSLGYHANDIYHEFLLDVLQDLSQQVNQFSHMTMSQPDFQTAHRESLSKILYLQRDLLYIPDEANLNRNTLPDFVHDKQRAQDHDLLKLPNPWVLVLHKNQFIDVDCCGTSYLSDPIDQNAYEGLKKRMPAVLGAESISEDELAKIFDLRNWRYPTPRVNNIFLLLALCKEWYTRLETEKKYWHDIKEQNQSMSGKFFLAACISVVLSGGINGLAVYWTAYASLLTTLATIAALGGVLFSIGLITYLGFTVLNYQKEQAFNAKLNTMNQTVQQTKSYQLPLLNNNSVTDFKKTYPALSLEMISSSKAVITPTKWGSIFDFFKQHEEGIKDINKEYFTPRHLR